MKRALPAAALVIAVAACSSSVPSLTLSASNGASKAQRAAPAKMLFDDEFNGSSLDSKIWYTCYPYARAKQGCSNNPGLELEWYQPANVTVSGGYLSLTAKAQPVKKGYAFTSGMVSTGGSPTAKASFAYLYGYAEARIKLPHGAGMWPAFWIIPKNRTWPPEIDFMEWQGVSPRDDIVTVHWGTARNPQQNGSSYDTGVALWSGYHVYGVDWERSYVKWYFDGKLIKTYTGTGIPHQPMYVILNLAIGGWEKGQLDPKPSNFPAVMSVDYVRVWNRKP